MVETKEIIGYGSTGILLTLIIMLGISVQPGDTHVCIEDEIVMHCERLSGTERTCYPSSDTTKGKKLCSGTWKPIIKDSIPIVPPVEQPEVDRLIMTCTNQGCV